MSLSTLGWTTDLLSWSPWGYWTKTLLTLKPELHENRMTSTDFYPAPDHLTHLFSQQPTQTWTSLQRNKPLLASQQCEHSQTLNNWTHTGRPEGPGGPRSPCSPCSPTGPCKPPITVEFLRANQKERERFNNLVHFLDSGWL